MQKKSFRKFSLLGLIILAASAVAAAVLPASKEKKDHWVLGSLTLSSDPVSIPKLTCTMPTVGDDKITQPCNITAGTGTTGCENNNSSDNDDSDSTIMDSIVP